MSKTVRTIIVDYLKSIGADGLVSPGLCGCGIDDVGGCDDIGVCDYINLDECVPAKKILCRKCEIKKTCIRANFSHEKSCFIEIKCKKHKSLRRK